MAKVYLDTNRLIDFVERKDIEVVESVSKHDVFVSVLFWHIAAYVCKWKIPNKTLNDLIVMCESIDLNKVIVLKALSGPTDDFEDNVQLHSAVAGDCDYFLTLDRRLLKMKYFGKMKISDKM
ncbi:hypothetical protein COS78_04390 [Candidatus Shapirobacteria bacterium CG06_land_8_20_14_3_00_40_12]|uniref:PIN domain-containing protein n=2 Tax=Candidatus Shapironibacteriota TaxID=1752721 RepID=A0A2M7TS63_9BACT|nr:MAG: hypothetical protein COS78_04390 [Candidatus Shapirobacteria bacterium CG06_land_8_20_14_3_00_40_12]PIZ58449.1 MAG: hypothetical protein COY20_03620 [Candidatus Shapirobacteria bacterium CG_4_10_14_0_2_um_filter_40_12]